MAQADPNIVGKLRKAILNICPYPRGCRNISEIYAAILKYTDKDGIKAVKLLADLLEELLFNSANKYFDNEPPFQLEKTVISGSFSEGTHKINFKTGVTSDIDFMLVLKNIKVTEDDQRKGNLTVKENTAFVNFYLTDEDLIKILMQFLETSNETQSEGKMMLSSMKLKERLRKKYTEYGPLFSQLNNEDVKETDDGPSIAVDSYTPGEGELSSHPDFPFPTSLFDLVLAIKCEGWPLCAQEWPSRLRHWPAQDVVHNIVGEGFHIVCKNSTEGNFRLSFSNAETLLIGNLTDLQHKTFRAFKSFVGHHKNEWSPNIKKIFCSYHLKTIVLWYCEKSDSNDWNEDTVVRHFLSLVDELIMALKEHSLPMYFMPKYNLMEKMEDGTEVARKIEEVRFNLSLISTAIILEEPTIMEVGNFTLTHWAPEILQGFQKGLERGKFEPNDFLEQLDNIIKGVSEFWMSIVGKVPTRNIEQGKEVLNTMLGPVTEFFKVACEKFNHFLQ